MLDGNLKKKKMNASQIKLFLFKIKTCQNNKSIPFKTKLGWRNFVHQSQIVIDIVLHLFI